MAAVKKELRNPLLFLKYHSVNKITRPLRMQRIGIVETEGAIDTVPFYLQPSRLHVSLLIRFPRFNL